MTPEDINRIAELRTLTDEERMLRAFLNNKDSSIPRWVTQWFKNLGNAVRDKGLLS